MICHRNGSLLQNVENYYIDFVLSKYQSTIYSREEPKILYAYH